MSSQGVRMERFLQDLRCGKPATAYFVNIVGFIILKLKLVTSNIHSMITHISRVLKFRLINNEPVLNVYSNSHYTSS